MQFDSRNLSQHFLTPDESNFSRVFELMALFQHAVAPSRFDTGARWGGSDTIDYSDTGTDWVIPEESLGDDAVAAAFREAFAGGVRWHSPLAMLNVTPPPLIHAVAAGAVASLYNQNALWDFTSGAFLQIEQRVARALWRLVSEKRSGQGGVSVSGGKSAMAYAIKLGINRAEPSAVIRGLRKRHLVFASEHAHYSVEWVLNQLGLGTDACVRIPCDQFGRVDVSILEQRLNAAAEEQSAITAIILSGGDTIDHVIDPIEDVCDALGRVKERHCLSYDPFVYVDLVNGWIWRLFAGYDFEGNSLGIESHDIDFVKRKLAELASLSRVDGLAVDLHKTGVCPYGASFFLCRSSQELLSIHGGKPEGTHDLQFGNLHAHHFTFENSRSTAGLAAAWITLNTMGIAGLRGYVVQLLRLHRLLTSELLAQSTHFEVLERPHAWRVPLFVPRFSYAMPAGDCQLVFEYYKRVNQLVTAGKAYPQLGIVPRYRAPGANPRACLLAYPMSLYTDQKMAHSIVSALVSLKEEMDNVDIGASANAALYSPKLPPR